MSQVPDDGLAMKSMKTWPPWLAAILFLLAFCVYLLTLAPSITWQHGGDDGGDLITATYNLGIPHPTGYPVYVMVGKLFTLLPWRDIAYRLNLMSAFFAAGAVAVVYLAILTIIRDAEDDPRSQLRPIVAAAVGSLILAFSPAFWSQAIITEVYALNAFCLSLVILLMLRAGRLDQGLTGLSSPRISLWLLALACGLSLGNHLLMLLFLPSVVIFLSLRCRRRFLVRDLVIALGWFALGLLPYLYLPLSSGKNPMVNWGDPRDLQGFLWVVTAAPYQSMLFSLPLHQVIDRLLFWVSMIPQQLTWIGVLLLVIGFWHCWEADPPLVFAFSVGLASNVIYTVNYPAANVEVYFIVSYVLMAIWVGLALPYLPELLQHPTIGKRVSDGSKEALTSRAPVLFLLLPTFMLAFTFPSLNLSTDNEAIDYGSQVLEAVDRDAIIVSDDDRYTFTLWYFIYVLGERPDVLVLDARLLRWEWYRDNLDAFYPDLHAQALDPKLGWSVATLLEDVEHHRPIYLTYEILLPPGYITLPKGMLFAVQRDLT